MGPQWGSKETINLWIFWLIYMVCSHIILIIIQKLGINHRKLILNYVEIHVIMFHLKVLGPLESCFISELCHSEACLVVFYCAWIYESIMFDTYHVLSVNISHFLNPSALTLAANLFRIVRLNEFIVNYFTAPVLH